MASDALVIAGATATGKTAVAVEVALRLGAGIVSMDSRQVYRGMDIGTAKPTHDERRGVPHYGFDLVSPAERFNAGRFAALARTWITEIRAAGGVPLLTGGTGFFLRALTHPLFEEPDLPADLKEAWKRQLAEFDEAELARWAAALNPQAERLPADRQRLSRLIEVALLSGRPLDWWQRARPSPEAPLDALVFVLDMPREELHQRINRRVDAMVHAGLVAEVAGLLAAGYDERDPGMHTTGYMELIPCIRGGRDLAAGIEMVKTATRQYARRQLTWLRHQLPPNAHWLDAREDVDVLAGRIADVWMEANG